MKQYILENYKDFDMKHIFECGQCFRWNKQEDGAYIGVIKDRILKVKQLDDKFIFYSDKIEDLESVVKQYFDLTRDYGKIKKMLSEVDDNLKCSVEYGKGIRVLNQDIWECIISFIISANNNIPRIKKIIENLSKQYGKKIIYENKEYFLFPTPEELAKASIEDLRNLGLGFRDKRVYTTTRMILNKEFDIDKMKNERNTEIIREALLKLDGVGEKVADCILLFAFNRFDVFPVDVWVRRVMNDLYIHLPDEKNVNKKLIREIAKEKFLGIEGLAQQYLFYWKRERKLGGSRLNE